MVSPSGRRDLWARLLGQGDVHPALPVAALVMQLPVPADDVAVCAERAREPGRLALHPPRESVTFLSQARLVCGWPVGAEVLRRIGVSIGVVTDDLGTLDRVFSYPGIDEVQQRATG